MMMFFRLIKTNNLDPQAGKAKLVFQSKWCSSFTLRLTLTTGLGVTKSHCKMTLISIYQTLSQTLTSSTSTKN